MHSLRSEPPAIPTVDLDDLDAEDPSGERHREALRAIYDGFSHFGLVYVRHHGISPDDLDLFYKSFTALTARPESLKRPLARADIWFQRGWTPPNTERAVVADGQPDFKECYFASVVPLDADCRIDHPEIYADNLWPDGIDGFESAYTTIGLALHSVGQKLLRGAALSLSLNEKSFTEIIDGGPHVTRALRYLPLSASQVSTGVLWGEEHTDFNLLTLLPGGRFIDPEGNRCAPPDSDSGLYLRTRATPEEPSGTRVRGRAPEGCLVAQVGQQWEILTGGTFLATPHGVTAPRSVGYSRLSCAHFVHVHPSTVLTPLGPFRTTETLRAYSPPVLAGTYALKTLVDINLAPPEALAKLGYRHYDRLETQRERER